MVGIISPAPIPCRRRKAIRLPMPHATAESAEPTRNSRSEKIHSDFPPNRSPAQPVTGIAMPSISR